MGVKYPSTRWQFWLGVLVLYSFSVYSGVQAGTSCKKGCSKSESGYFQYAPGSVYEYNFDSIMTIAVGTSVSGENDDSSLKVAGNAKIFAEGNCQYTLQLSAVKVTATKEGSIEKRITQVITKPVHFTMNDGSLEPEICADSADDVYSLNIKRAVISLLQSSHTEETKSEIDVFGQCLTHTTISKSGAADIITKMRNLNNCAYREQLVSGIVNGVVNEKAGIKATMLLQADYAKEAKVQKGVIQEVHLVENYNFAGTQKTGANVKAKVTTNLKLKNVGNAPAPAAAGNHVDSLIFQKSDIHATKNIASLKALMSDILQTSTDYVQKDNAKKFVDFIRLLRNADADTLLELGSVPFPNKVLARKVYLDGLFRTGTAESARAIIKQFGKLSEKEKALGLLSLNLVQVVDKETIVQIGALITPTTPNEVYLAVGNLVSKYCRKQSCETLPEIQALSKKVTDALKHCKANTKKEEERILNVLKGIGSSYSLASNAAPVLTECVTPGRPLRLRVAALQAFSAASCSDAIRQKALQVLRDHNEDSELRIEAYLAIVECPSAELANELAQIVNNEPVNQVGGFIASHLRALRDSTDAHRESQRHYLSNIRITKIFPEDIRRFSYNNEISYRVDALGVSASADYKLIYSQHGFLPRSARLNVSSEIFGVDFNVLEGSVRQDNLESVLEYYLGPKGLLNKDFDEIIKASGSVGGRARRSIADDTTKFAKKYKDYGSKNIDELNLDLSLKLFGSEIFFLSLGDHIPTTLDDITTTFGTLFEGFKNEISNFQKEFNMHTLFLDAELIYPTGLGLPLELSAQGLAANKLDFGINVDIDSLLQQNWQKAKYRLKVVPSVDVNVDFRVGFNAYVLSTGLRVSSSLHSATGADMNLAFINDNGFTLDIQLPREKLELVNVKLETDFYVGEQEKQIKSVAPKATKKTKPDDMEMCFDQLKAMGFTLCFYTHGITAEKSEDRFGPDSWLNPFDAGVFITTERNYHFTGQHIPQTPAGTKQWKLDFSTPGSQESHDTSLAFELGVKPRAFGRISLDFPQYHLALEAGLNNDDREFVLYAQYEHNDELKKNKIGFVKNGNEYRPLIAVQGRNGETVNDINGYRADGRVIVQKTDEKHARYNFENFQITNDQKQRLVINGWTEVGPSALTAELHVAPGQESYFVKSNFKMDNGVYEVGTFVNNERTPDNVIGGSVHLTIADGIFGATLIGKGQSWEVLTKNNIQYAKPDTGLNVITSSKFESELAIKHKQQIVFSVAIDGYTEGDDKLGFDLKAVRGKSTGSLAVKYQANQRAQNDFLVEVNGKLNKHFVDILAKCDVSGNHFVIDNTISTSWGTAITVKGQLGQRYTPQDILIDLNGSLQLNDKDKQSQFVFKVIGAPEKTLAEFKLARDNEELVKFNGETQHPQDKISNGKLNLVVKNIISTNADFKIAKNGKGDLNAHIETLRTEPKHKVEVTSKFHVQAPKYDVEATIVLDGDKKIFVKTENQIEKLKFVTKNVVEIAEKKLTFDANANVKGADWRSNSEIIGNFILKSPTGHVIDGSMKRKIATNLKTNIAQGTMELQLNEQVDGKKRTLVYNGKLEKFNVRTKDISLESQLVLTNTDAKKLDVKFHVKHLPKGNGKQRIDFAIGSNGNLLDLSPYELTLLVDEYDSKHAVVRVNGKYGNEATANFNGNYNIGERNAPSTFELQANVQAPNTALKSWEISTNGKYQKPQNADGVGNHQLELHLNEKSTSNNGDQFVKLNIVYRGARQQGSYNFDVQTERMQGPMKIEGTYQREHTGDSVDKGNVKQKYTSNFAYGDKYLRSSFDLTNISNERNFKIHYTLDSSFETARQVDIELKAHAADDESHFADAQMSLNGQQYALNSKIYQGIHKKGLDLKVKLPQSPKEVIVTGIFEILGERKAKLTIKIDNLAELDFNGELEAAYKDVEKFYVIGNWNSARLQLNNYNLEFRSQNKAITINLKNAQGVIISGNAAYVLKKERNKAIIEGQGQVQYKGQAHNTNFKIIRQVYEAETDKEVGFSYTFNGNFGPKNGVSTFKITNKDFNIKFSVCEEKKQCTNLQIQSQLTASDGAESSFPLESLQHSLLVLIDFRELGYPYEFELQSKTIRHGLKLTYNLDSHIISNNNLKYLFIVNVLPNTSKLQLKLPNREILFESQSQHPENGWLGKYVNSAAFYFDKTRNPNDVTRLTSTIELSGVENGLAALNAQGEIRFEHPTIRPLVVSGKADLNRQQQIANIEIIFDIFKLPEQRLVAVSRIENSKHDQRGFNITSHHQIHSSGLGLQYELNEHTAYDVERHEFSAAANVRLGNEINSNIWAFISKDRLDLSVHGLNEPILNVNGEFNRQKYGAKFDSKLYLFGQKPFDINTEVQPTFAKLQLKREGLTNANVELRLGKELKFNVDGAGKELVNGRIALDGSNFLQTTYNSNEDNIKQFLDRFEAETKAETAAAHDKIKQRLHKLRQQIEQNVQLSKNSIPDFTQFWSNYQRNLKDIVTELEQDPALKHIADSLHAIYTKLAKIAADVTKTWSEAYERLHSSFVTLGEKFQVILSETIIPAWEEFAVTATKLLGEIRVEVVNIYTKAVGVILSVLEKYGPALKNYGKAIYDALKPYNEALQEFYKIVANAIEEISNEFNEWIANLPTFDAIRAEIREKLEKLKLTEKALEVLNTIFEQLHILPPTPETNAFFERLHTYLESKLKGQTVNDAQAVEDIVKHLLQALRAILSTIEINLPFSMAGTSTEGIRAFLSSLPKSLDFLSSWPGFLSFRFSGLNFILNEDWLSIFNRDYLNQWVYYHDFDLRGHIADGQHVFTFDGQYFPFRGNCKYILAQDSKDNNFTVVAQLNNGKLKSLILADRDGSFYELSDTGALKLNGNPVEYPSHEASGMHAWRKYYTIWLLSEYGVQIMCTNDLKVCHIDVNGFYTSRTRGLLGNGNAEPYDDFVQVDGTIAQDSASFGNGYGLGKCNPVAPQQNSEVPHNEICTDIFGLESPLAFGYLVENVRPYRKACDIAVQEANEKDKESTACNIALAYGSVISLEHQLSVLPERCLKCPGPAAQRDLYQEFTVKIPNNKADVVFVIDVGVTPSVLANLVAPAVTEIRETLKARGFTDVQVGVIAYNESQKYPALLTSDNGKLNYHGNVATLQLNGPRNFCDGCLSSIITEKYVLEAYELIEKVIKTIVPQSDELAFGYALSYPFRAGAAKTVIDVRSDNLEYGNVLKWMRAHIAEAVTKFDGAVLHLIAPVKGMSLEGISAEKLIGFNSRLVATLDGKDAKKRQKLQFDTDMGIDFVLNSGGWVFGTQNFDNLKPAEQRKALNQVTNSIADTLFKTEIVSDCRCLPVHGLHAQHVCAVKSSNFQPNKKVKTNA